MKFNWSWCPICECAMVICPQCGNNTCNGRCNCDLCKECFNFVDNSHKSNKYPHSEAEIDKYNQ
jgi:hypothetical protein